MGRTLVVKKCWQCEGNVDSTGKTIGYHLPTGWVCPNCHKIYSPDTKECGGCNEG